MGRLKPSITFSPAGQQPIDDIRSPEEVGVLTSPQRNQIMKDRFNEFISSHPSMETFLNSVNYYSDSDSTTDSEEESDDQFYSDETLTRPVKGGEKFEALRAANIKMIDQEEKRQMELAQQDQVIPLGEKRKAPATLMLNEDSRKIKKIKFYDKTHE